jgi:hypothetical protein
LRFGTPKDISQMEKRYSGKWNPNMLSDYYKGLIRKIPTGKYQRPKKM